MIDLDIAKAWHKFFAEEVEFAAKGLLGRPLAAAAVRDDGACKLGRWLHGEGRQMAGRPGYAALKEAHERFHAAAGDYLAGGGRAALEAPFLQASADVVAAMEQCRNACPQAAAGLGAAAPAAWDEALDTGLPMIDQQHREIVAVLNKLLQAPEESLHSELAVDCLTDVGELLQMHFSMEEACMRQLGVPLPEYEAHRQRHTDIINQYAELNVASFRDRDKKIRDMVPLVRQWAIEHVVDYDLNLRRYRRG